MCNTLCVYLLQVNTNTCYDSASIDSLLLCFQAHFAISASAIASVIKLCKYKILISTLDVGIARRKGKSGWYFLGMPKSNIRSNLEETFQRQ